MAAAIIAERRIPAIKPGKRVLTISINTLSCVPPSTRPAPKTVLLAIKPMTMAAPRVKTTQIMATVALFFTSFALRIDMNLIRMCGMPK